MKHVLVMMSLRSSERDWGHILKLEEELKEWTIAVCHTDVSMREIPVWVEHEVKAADTVLCVCNAEFAEEWVWQDSITPITCFRSLLLTHYRKTAMVLLKDSHRPLIPTDYLRGVRCFFVNQSREMAHFITGVPEMELQREGGGASSEGGGASSESLASLVPSVATESSECSVDARH